MADQRSPFGGVVVAVPGDQMRLDQAKVREVPSAASRSNSENGTK